MGANGSHHHKGKGRIPGTGQVQKGQDGVGPGHPGDAEPQGEDHATGKGSHEFHEFPPSKWKALAAAIPRPMKAQVATRDRPESRVRPQIP